VITGDETRNANMTPIHHDEAQEPAGRFDRYPSRTGDEPRISERKDAVLHAGPDAPGPRDRDTMDRFDRDGFLTLDALLTPDEAGCLEAELERMAAERHGDGAPEVILEPDGDAVRSVFAVHRGDGVFARLARDPRLVGLAEQILGSPVYIHQSRVNLKPAFDGREFWWHSDFETWHVEDGMPAMRAVSISIHLTPAHAGNGPLMVIPGSHRWFASCPGRTPNDHHLASLRRQEYGVPDREHLRWLADRGGRIETAMGGPGSAVVFDSNAMHGSNANISPHPRHGVFLVYNSIENQLVEPYCGLAPRPDYIASRSFDAVTLR
jgi:ectoine hydroxylase